MNRLERRKRSFNKYIQRLKYWTRILKSSAIKDPAWRYAESYKELIGLHPWTFCKTTNSPYKDSPWKCFNEKHLKKEAYKRMLDTLNDTEISINYKTRRI